MDRRECAAWLIATVGITETAEADEEGQSAGLPSVAIGEQAWMTTNLNVDRFRNGDPIPEARSADEWVTATTNKEDFRSGGI